MSNARNLANLLGTGSTIATAKIADDAITAAKIATDAVVADGLSSSAITSGDLPAGSVLQVIQTIKTDTASTTSTSYSAISGLSASITPSSTSSKIYVMVSLSASSTGGLNAGGAFRLYRGGSDIGSLNGGSSGNRTTAMAQSTSGTNSPWMVINSAVNLLDSPSSTSAQTYQVYWRAEETGTGSILNRGADDADSTDRIRTSSSIVVMEIAG